MNRISTLAIVVVAVLATGGCVNRDAQAQAKKTQAVLSDQVIPVQVELAVGKPFIEMLEITGSLTSADDAQIGARISGRLVEVLVKDGDQVSAGQVIARQDSRESRTKVRQAQAQLDSAMSAVRQAETDALVGPQRSMAAVRTARAQLASAEANLLKARNGARSEERRQAEAQLRAAKTSLDIAKKDLDRGQKLLDEGAISEKEFDRYRQTYANALAQYESAIESNKLAAGAARFEDIRALESQVSAAREQLQTALAGQRLDSQFRDRVAQAQAQLRSAQDQLDLAQQSAEDADIRAPFSGRIAGKPLQIGTYVGPGTSVARIVGSEGIYLEGQVPEVKIASIKTGMAVAIELDALSGKTVTGYVAAISPQAESLGRLYKVRISLEGVSSDVKVGMFARAKVELNRRADVITVPAGAVLGETGSQFVYVIEGAKAMKRVVTTGQTQLGRIEVTGLTEGDKVVVQGQSQLQSGTPIRIEDTKGA